jgi:hypothetical protein
MVLYFSDKDSYTSLISYGNLPLPTPCLVVGTALRAPGRAGASNVSLFRLLLEAWRAGSRWTNTATASVLEHIEGAGLEMAMGTRYPKPGGFLLY